MADVQLPLWDKIYPGRLDHEIGALRAHAKRVSVDEESLKEGDLKVELDWQLSDGTEVSLLAEYPQGFPRLRPHVTLTSDPDRFPRRHKDPIGNALCLLGRGGEQWQANDTLADVLSTQLEGCLFADGEEDNQGEPDEFWWNAVAHPDSYILVDSGWEAYGDAIKNLKLRYILKGGKWPFLRGVVIGATDVDGKEIDLPNIPAPATVAKADNEIEVPCVHLDEEFSPAHPGIPDQIWRVISEAGLAEKLRPQKLSLSNSGTIVAISYPTELDDGLAGRGWLFVLLRGQKNKFDKKIPQVFTQRTLRAGVEDISVRAPLNGGLAGKTISVLGVGAVGSQIAIELAKAGVGKLILLDKDRIEPGNSVRWPVGATAWGVLKTEALREFIMQNYPWVTVREMRYNLGVGANEELSKNSDRETLLKICKESDLVIDCTAFDGVTYLAADSARETGTALISAYATPGLKGGAVAFFAPSGACPICLEHHYLEKALSRPRDEEDGMVQPKGCAERTFEGSSADILEISLQAVRMMADYSGDCSAVATVDFRRAENVRLPHWSLETFDIHGKCSDH